MELQQRLRWIVSHWYVLQYRVDDNKSSIRADGGYLIGPTLVSPSLIPDPSKLRVRGIGNKGEVLQDCGTDDLIFSIPKLVSFLSQSTTLPPGTVIITGTPAGVGFAKSPKYTLKSGEEFKVEILPHIGTLVSVFEAEK